MSTLGPMMNPSEAFAEAIDPPLNAIEAGSKSSVIWPPVTAPKDTFCANRLGHEI
jgi:hypothetical protein